MAKILNLDKIAQTADQAAKRELVLRGVTYVVEPMTVENFVLSTREAEEMIKEGASLSRQVEQTITMITRSIPTLSREALNKESMETLGRIAAFCRNEDPEGTENESAEGGQGNE